MTLTKLTGQEAGIICYGGKSVAVVNWSSCGDDQIPMLSPFGGEMLPWTEQGLLAGAKRRVVDDVRDELPGTVWMTDDVAPDGTRTADSDMDIVYDRNCDLIRLFLDISLTDDDRAGIVYDLRSGRKVIVIPAWDGQPISVQTIARRAGMSCRKLAERFGIPYRTMEQWSAGEHLPPPYVINMIREILGV